MTAAMRTALRERHYTYYEMLAFAQYYHDHRYKNSPENLLAAFTKLKEVSGDLTIKQRLLLLIEATVVNYYGLALQDVRGKRRYLELVRARQVISYFTVRYASQNTIANAIGFSRNNIQYGKTKCAELMETERLLRKEVADIEKRLEEPIKAILAEAEKLAKETDIVGDADKEGK